MNFADYIGIPWQAGAQGPDAFDCMSFFGFVQKHHFNIDVPSIIAPDYENPAVLVALFRHHEERQRWETVAHPFEGCAVLMRKPMHIGVWLDADGGGVLHCVRGCGVVFTKDSAWPTSGFGRREYLKVVLCPQ